MKNHPNLFRLCMILLLLLSNSQTFFAVANSKMIIFNKSNAPISITLLGKSNSGDDVDVTSAVVAPGEQSYMVFAPTHSLSAAQINYFQADEVTALDPVSIVCTPPSLAKSVFVYGNNAIPVSSLDTATVGNILPARYVAWWTGTLDASKYSTPAAAIADQANRGLVSIYMLSLDGKNLLTLP